MISVIVPVYNVKPYIGLCLNSVKRQTFKDWECIVVNDGSTDGSDECIKEITEGDNRFTVLNYENAGLPTARNRGIAASHGDKLFFLDSDDWIEPNTLDILNSYCEIFPDVGRIIGLDYVHWEQQGWSTYWSITPGGLHKPDSPHPFSNADCDPGHATGCIYVKKNIPCELSFPKVRLFEDLVFNIGLIYAGVSMFVTPYFLYHYERREGSLITTFLTDEQADTIRKALSDLAEKYNPPKETHERCSKFLENAIKGRMK